MSKIGSNAQVSMVNSTPAHCAAWSKKIWKKRRESRSVPESQVKVKVMCEMYYIDEVY